MKESKNIVAHSRVVSIDSRASSAWADFAALWEYRELLSFLTWRDIKIRYNSTVIGLTWVIVRPLATVIIFSLLFGRMVGIDSEGVPYPVFAFAGVVPWVFFSSTITSCSNSLVGSSNLITKVYFPRLIIPAAALIAGLVDFLIALLFMIGLMVYYQLNPTLNLIILPYLIVITALLTLGFGILVSALTVRFRDIQHILPFFIQLLMFVTPVIYPTSILPSNWKRVAYLNPLAGIIDGYRSVLLGRPFRLSSMILSALTTSCVLMVGVWYFRRTEDSFADII